MTPDKQPEQQEYIITEKQLNEISVIDRFTTKMENHLYAIRSRPHTQAPEEKTLTEKQLQWIYDKICKAQSVSARAAMLAAQNRGALEDLTITQIMLYEFCEWFCDHNCEESPCKITVSYLHERMEGIKKQMSEHPEYLKKWEKMRNDQKIIRQQAEQEPRA